MEVTYRTNKAIETEKIIKLYNDAEWSAYTNDPSLLQQALLQSLMVISAWDEAELVGLIRVVGDGLTIIYIQDILVLKAYRNRGIATQLMQRILEEYAVVRQKVLLTDDPPDVRGLYEKNGFVSCDQGTLVAFAKLT
ncbi:GNAT family N-acetyltransferase [Paenibacillus sp. DMB5]|uniref:GNAT family N-acetyltransferase n=1 Tax=Paenibacillus sp. DMB5 TaxID=1780103 RepID=UPI00076D7445|nr:GNAT family N-acetyltransferase [Paenibacillus sp. DMB5]KUP25709.1 GNAT family acetyltransferase [Paenibacillus sp. DMB5]